MKTAAPVLTQTAGAYASPPRSYGAHRICLYAAVSSCFKLVRLVDLGMKFRVWCCCKRDSENCWCGIFAHGTVTLEPAKHCLGTTTSLLSTSIFSYTHYSLSRSSSGEEIPCRIRGKTSVFLFVDQLLTVPSDTIMTSGPTNATAMNKKPGTYHRAPSTLIIAASYSPATSELKPLPHLTPEYAPEITTSSSQHTHTSASWFSL